MSWWIGDLTEEETEALEGVTYGEFREVHGPMAHCLIVELVKQFQVSGEDLLEKSMLDLMKRNDWCERWASRQIVWAREGGVGR